VARVGRRRRRRLEERIFARKAGEVARREKGRCAKRSENSNTGLSVFRTVCPTVAVLLSQLQQGNAR
jgi:hypothetical protein